MQQVTVKRFSSPKMEEIDRLDSVHLRSTDLEWLNQYVNPQIVESYRFLPQKFTINISDHKEHLVAKLFVEKDHETQDLRITYYLRNPRIFVPAALYVIHLQKKILAAESMQIEYEPYIYPNMLARLNCDPFDLLQYLATVTYSVIGYLESKRGQEEVLTKQYYLRKKGSLPKREQKSYFIPFKKKINGYITRNGKKVHDYWMKTN